MPQRTSYQKLYYQSNKNCISQKRQDRYALDMAYKARCRKRDSNRYHLHKQWAGLLSIDPHLFEN